MWGQLRHAREEFEYDAKFQTKFHLRMAYFWAVNLIVASLVFFFARPLWDKASVYYLVIVSLYANLATDYGAASASEASDAAHQVAPK